MRVSLSFTSSKAALLLVDFQEEQRVDPTIQPENLDNVLGNAQRLLSVARERRIPVFHAGYVRASATRRTRLWLSVKRLRPHPEKR
jgi:nicotinamidase-related amidase